jgi:hypothetical protein
MTWEDAAAKYRSHSPTAVAELAPLNGRPLSPASFSSKPLSIYTHDPQDMDIDSTPPHQSTRSSLPDSRIRTPLPSGPRLDKPANVTPLPSIDSVKTDVLQSAASRVASNPHRNPYQAVEVLALHWIEDDDLGVRTAIEDLANVLSQFYHYTFALTAIPSSTDGCKNSWRWLSRAMTEFIDHRDQRDVLKVVYYSGHSYLDGNREMVLARFVSCPCCFFFFFSFFSSFFSCFPFPLPPFFSHLFIHLSVHMYTTAALALTGNTPSHSSRNADADRAIRWSGIQQILESASSDTLIIMDAPYYPSSSVQVRQQGVLELIAACASEEHARCVERGAFTRALTAELRTRANQKFMSPLSAAELHAKLLTLYPKIYQDRNPEKEVVTSFPSPLHMQLSGNARLPSILLAPVQKVTPYGMESPPSAGSSSGSQLTFTFTLADEPLNVGSWIDWLRLMPVGVRDVKVDGPYRNTLR